MGYVIILITDIHPHRC